MIIRGSRDSVVCKLAVLCVGSFCSNKDTIFTSLFQVCSITTSAVILLPPTSGVVLGRQSPSSEQRNSQYGSH